MTKSTITRELVHWLHDAATEFASTKLKMTMKPDEVLALTGALLASMDTEPVGWTDEAELRDVEKDGCGYLFKANPISPHADPRRVIKLYRHAQPAQVVPEEATPDGTVAKLAMRQPFVLFKGLTFQKLCLPGAFRPGDHHNK
ncbi:hypothetical protein ACSVOX_24200, partial [Klebsiella pneumoniae]|nr:hypothetical protein [Klebsiella pneumoniae]MCL0604504.1 hypothetical protein [Klebsiella pneumoniae]MCL0646638.1 hypothetical protein [Klebsiella pneumoniae]MCL0651812.1 hypothetical protein [Klebsiella pneumoniae]MCL0662026.1 hypothetical protein [Klebsiella pneumoniae]